MPVRISELLHAKDRIITRPYVYRDPDGNPLLPSINLRIYSDRFGPQDEAEIVAALANREAVEAADAEAQELDDAGAALSPDDYRGRIERLKARLDELEDQASANVQRRRESFALLSRFVAGWDVVDDAGQELPFDEANIIKAGLSYTFIASVLQFCGEELSPNRRKRAGFAPGSRRQGR